MNKTCDMYILAIAYILAYGMLSISHLMHDFPALFILPSCKLVSQASGEETRDLELG